MGQDEAKMGKDGPRMDYVGQVVSTLCRSWADIVQKLQEEWKMAAGHWRGRSKMGLKMGPKWVQEQSKMDQDEREGSISRP